VPAEHLVLAQLLSLSGLVAGTAEYSTVIRRRVERRRVLAEQQAAESAGLQGLVRVFLADTASGER
jgi:hypothetical protein